jgi:HEPN domain-containing protein
MVDIEKQIVYWQNGAAEDWEVACHLLDRGNARHGLFLLHLAVEKALKALVCRHTNALAPKEHNLVVLSEMASLSMSEEYREILGAINTFNIEGRYPGSLPPLPQKAEVSGIRKRAEEIYQWLLNQ